MEKVSLDSVLKGDLMKSYAHWSVPSPLPQSDMLSRLFVFLNRLYVLQRFCFCLVTERQAAMPKVGNPFRYAFLIGSTQTSNLVHAFDTDLLWAHAAQELCVNLNKTGAVLSLLFFFITHARCEWAETITSVANAAYA